MAPRYASLEESLYSDNNNQQEGVSYSSLELKPRLNLWDSSSSSSSLVSPSASFDDAWTSTSTTQKQGQRTAKKHVRFATLSQSQDYINLDEYSPEEKVACWFTRSEVKEIKRSRRQIINDPSINLENEWGLELCGSNYTYYEIIQARNNVLQEQDDQLRWDGYVNPAILAARYMTYTLSSMDRAQWLGNYYAKEVSNMLL